MEKQQVPQDDGHVLEGKFKVLKYAVDKDGSYVKVPTVGWEPENIALEQAWEVIHEKIASVKAKVLAKELSPVAYYMEKHMMDIGMLAAYTGFWRLSVKRHLKWSAYQQLSIRKKEKYAQLFRINVEQLDQLVD